MTARYEKETVRWDGNMTAQPMYRQYDSTIQIATGIGNMTAHYNGSGARCIGNMTAQYNGKDVMAI